MLCFGYINAAFQSFFHVFCRFLQTLFMCKCMFIIICSLLMKVDLACENIRFSLLFTAGDVCEHL